ncbi:MAG: cytochrome c peroxidase [Thiohalocapsa sp.]|jgi:cytochrome c peroxidase
MNHPNVKRSALALALALTPISVLAAPPLGLPEVPIPADNPQTQEKIALGEKLFNDKRFSATGEIGCVSCHAPEKAFTDSPKAVSEGVRALTGTRNAPTVINAVYLSTQFWDGREPTLEAQSLQPFVNPVEGGLEDHGKILEVVRSDPGYRAAFEQVFGAAPDAITMEHVSKAIASFERTLLAGDSPFDRYYYGGDEDAMTEQQIRGLSVFLVQGRCNSCHVIEQDHALFTDNRFHNVGVGINRIEQDVPALAEAFLEAKNAGAEVDVEVLTDPRSSELGRFAVTDDIATVGAFKTPTLRNVALTAPYMHDGSLATLEEVVEHYDNGGFSGDSDHANAYLSGGIRPLGLTERQEEDLVAFLEALTSPRFAELATASAAGPAAKLPATDTSSAR